MLYVCFNGIQRSGHLLIMLLTCNITISGEWKLTTISGCTVSFHSSRQGHIRALLTLQYGITHGTWHRKSMISPNDGQKKEITYVWRHSVDLVLYSHLKDSGYSGYKMKIHKGVMKHSLHLSTEYIHPASHKSNSSSASQGMVDLYSTLSWVTWEAVTVVEGISWRGLLRHRLANGALVYPSEGGRYCAEGCMALG
jgi:hypothetical protein